MFPKKIAMQISITGEPSRWKRLALLSVLPCYVLVALIAASSIMHLAKPVLFKGDFVLFGFILFVYAIGIFMSYKQHLQIWPMLLMVATFSGMGIVMLAPVAEEWMLLPLLLLILTSVSNQYYRTGSIECNACAENECAVENQVEAKA
jgi:hypothetical protein